MLVEICANSLESALNAQEAGAHRIELCTELSLGGVTPSFGLIKQLVDHMKIPVHVLIRPRSGDFTYTNHEFQTMLSDIENCVSMGVSGIVSGILLPDNRIDVERTRTLIAASGNCTFTFHRAFDWVPDPLQAFQQLQNEGVEILLSSGQAESAQEGMVLLQQLNALSKSCIVMPGAGIREHNAAMFKKAGFKAIHLSATKTVKRSSKQTLVNMGSSGDEKQEILLTDPEIVKNVVKLVN